MSYALPPAKHNPLEIAARLIEWQEHKHLKDFDAKIDWLMRDHPRAKAGRSILGSAHIPSVQGELSDCFEWLLNRLFGRIPDFLIILDARWWGEFSPLQQEILVYHELSHCVIKSDAYGTPRFHRDGTPIWGLKGHDVEEFTETVRRYGAYNSELQEFIDAARQHG